MKVNVTKELMEVFRRILAEGKSPDEWAEIESDDRFQSGQLCGGFDATERAFCFSLYDDDGKEYWFQLGLDEMKTLSEQTAPEIDVRPADH